jgi:hypothetical protein
MSKKKYNTMLEQTYMLTPDSLLTKEQIAQKIRVNDYLYTYITSDNNKQKLPVSRKDIKSYGIPALYYDIIQYQIKETNSYIGKAKEEGLFTDENFNGDLLLMEAKERYWSTERPLLVKRLEE